MDTSSILKLAEEFEQLVKLSFIRKLPNGQYRVVSRKGRNLGTYKSKEQAKKRLKQVEYFKHVNKADDQDLKIKNKKIDLSKIDNFSYSAIVRELNKNASKKQLFDFIKTYKYFFDQCVSKDVQSPDKVALKKTINIFNKKYDLNIDSKLVKNAAIVELGNADVVADYLAAIIRFILLRISLDKRPNAIFNLKNRFRYIDENDIAVKKLPASSAIGQSIAFVKNVLFNHNAKYIRDVLDGLAKKL